MIRFLGLLLDSIFLCVLTDVVVRNTIVLAVFAGLSVTVAALGASHELAGVLERWLANVQFWSAVLHV